MGHSPVAPAPWHDEQGGQLRKSRSSPTPGGPPIPARASRLNHASPIHLVPDRELPHSPSPADLIEQEGPTVGGYDAEATAELMGRCRNLVRWLVGTSDKPGQLVNHRLRVLVLASLSDPTFLRDQGYGDGSLADIARACHVSRQRVSDVALSLKVWVSSPGSGIVGKRVSRDRRAEAGRWRTGRGGSGK
jgi:hypothetical protein